MGLFGSVNVQAKGAEWYRSQVTAEELKLAQTGVTPAGQPLINYDAVYPIGHPKAGKPILKMLNVDTIVHTDLNAIITGPNKGRFRQEPSEPIKRNLIATAHSANSP